MDFAIDDRTFVVTAKLDDTSASRLTALRTRYFPPSRNYLDAHLTLFHKLDAASLAPLESVASEPGVRRFDIELADAYPLGRGVALRVRSAELVTLRDRIAARLQTVLTPQDRQPFRPHVTIQNKVTPEEASLCLAEVRGGGYPRQARVEGLDVWEYRGGPWSLHARYSFEELRAG